MNDYTDIIHMERPLSSHPKMDLGNRAKLFSSFDALRGFDLALLAKQVERQLTVRASLLDDAQELLDRKLHMVQPGAKVSITYFRMEKMIGDTEVGTYITETGRQSTCRKRLLSSPLPISTVRTSSDWRGMIFPNVPVKWR